MNDENNNSDQRGNKPGFTLGTGLALIIWGIGLIVVAGGVYVIRAGHMSYVGVEMGDPNANAYRAVAFGVMIVLACLGFALLCSGCLRWSVTEPILRDAKRTSLRVEQIARVLPVLSDRALLSEISKRIAFREKDRETLRRAIQEDIDKGDFEAALSLVHDMADNYGYIEESEQYRDQILLARHENTERRIDLAIKDLQRLIGACNWTKAFQEAGKINRLFPDSLRGKMLGKMVSEAYEIFKGGLGNKITQAEQVEDVDSAYRLLRVMDIHLTAEEALPYRELAKRVVKRKREKLNLQFRLAMESENWAEGLRIAELVIREFPNSKMAADARKSLEDLRAKAVAVGGGA